MAQAQVKKVGGVAAAKQAGGAVAAAAHAADKNKGGEKKGRKPFDIKTAVYADPSFKGEGQAPLIPVPLDEDDRLTQAPLNWDRKSHKGLKRSQFADEASFNEFKAIQIDQQIALMKLQADKYRDDARTARQYGDPEKRKALGKIEKIAKQYLELQASLQGDGAQGLPSLEEIMAKVQAQMQQQAAATATAEGAKA
jgi:hypothetical protein